MQRDRGNCLPLRVDEAPNLNLMTPFAWLHEGDSTLLLGMARQIHDRVTEEGGNQRAVSNRESGKEVEK